MFSSGFGVGWRLCEVVEDVGALVWVALTGVGMMGWMGIVWTDGVGDEGRNE